MSKKANSAPDLPEDVLVHILVKLPIKFILICTSVCKAWKSLIKNPNFISSHINYSISRYNENNTHLCFLRFLDCGKNEYSLRIENQELAQYAKLHVPLKFRFELRIFGSCNGLVCLGGKRFSPEKLYLWNPVIRKSVLLPRSNLDHLDLVGVGFDCSGNDYKVLAFSSPVYGFSKIGLYSLKANSWKRLSNVELEHTKVGLGVGPMAFLHGTLHFVASRFEGLSLGHRNLILGLHMSDEVCCEIMLPNDLAYCSVTDISVKVRDDMLSVVCSSQTDMIFQIWVMKEYGVEASWTQLAKFRARGWRLMPMPLSFRKNGDVLLSVDGFWVDDPGKIVVYDVENKVTKYLDIWGEKSSFFVDSYVESLVLLDIGRHQCLGYYKEIESCDACVVSDRSNSSNEVSMLDDEIGTKSNAMANENVISDDSRDEESADLGDDSDESSEEGSDYSEDAAKDLTESRLAAKENLSNDCVAGDSSFHGSNDFNDNASDSDDAVSWLRKLQGRPNDLRVD